MSPTLKGSDPVRCGQCGQAIHDLKRHLSNTEMQVMLRVVDGFSDEEIGRQLGISPNTVMTHKQRVKKKLAAKNSRQAAILFALATR